ncbi:hypothetical protein [Haloferula sp. BvORR071]|uniref:hypothetical protein n=1 Tax=Haloferula sp. BvORR071 TaxID=1396141 RepID=UPI00054E27F5|nr:hypothetical protein [Haloferula sp. BvORR071]
MPSIVLRHASDSDSLTRAVESLAKPLDARWSPGDRRSKSRQHENFGFNLCLVDREGPVGECLEEALRRFGELEQQLSALGQSLRGCVVDIGIFGDPAYFTRSVRLSASQCARWANLGVDFEVSFYPSSQPEP